MSYVAQPNNQESPGQSGPDETGKANPDSLTIGAASSARPGNVPTLMILRVAVGVPLYQTFDYLAPDGWNPADLRPGMRLRVPFGRRRQCAILVEIDTRSEAKVALRHAEAVLDSEALLSEADLRLLLWAARYYAAPPGEVLIGALPTRLRSGAPLRPPEGWRLTSAGQQTPLGALGRAPRRRAVIEELSSHPDGITESRMAELASPTVLRALHAAGLIERCEPPTPCIGQTAGPISSTHELTNEQAGAVSALEQASPGFRAYLLEGITGSGKTEVYLRLVQHHLSLGHQALMLVPEIGLTPQLVRRVQSRCRVTVAVLHSGLADGDREKAWFQARSGNARIVLGTRSAIFAPIPQLGVIVVDEEHDSSFKQQEGVRYSARDLAVVRAMQRDCPVVLGSATPSLETLRNAECGRYTRLLLRTRAGGARPPQLGLLDVRKVHLQCGLAPQLVELMERKLHAGDQVLLFLNRRGYAPVMTCHSCGWVSSCSDCDARMVFHKSEGRLRCHHCGIETPAPIRCPACGSDDLRGIGQGTERLEEWLHRRFPDFRTVRIDRDATRSRGTLASLLREIRSGRYQILLGTQMLAKGHHFPAVTLAGIVDADYGLYSVDFRGSERMAQLLIQVAGRAGRGRKPGQVVIQTRHPDHPVLRVLINDGYSGFAALALAERRETELPPFTYQALLRADGSDLFSVLEFLAGAAAAAGALGFPEVAIWGPVPAPMEKRRGRRRAQLLLQSERRDRVQALLAAWLPVLANAKPRGGIRWTIDVDPMEMA